MAKFLYGMRRGLVTALLLAAAVLASGCPLLHATRRPPPFPSRFTPVAEPPQGSLLLWLAANDPDTLQVDGQGRVTRWNDRRSPSRAVVALPGFLGRVKPVLVLPPGGTRREVRALSCGGPESRCSYGLVDPTAPRGSLSLDGTPYSLFAVVQRNSGRGDNYFVMTTGTGCQASAGGTGCRSNSALHLGWSGGRTVRLGQYDNDAVMDNVPAFPGGVPPLSLFHGFSGPLLKTVGLLEPPSANFVSAGGNPTLLSGSGQVMVGGTPFPVIDCPDWSFDGQIVALLLYTRVLEEPLRLQAEAYLRGLYGPL